MEFMSKEDHFGDQILTNCLGQSKWYQAAQTEQRRLGMKKGMKIMAEVSNLTKILTSILGVWDMS